MLASYSTRLEWLERVARDPECRGLPCAVAVLLAAKYINSKSGRAWPAVATLATALKANRRSVQHALDRLVEAGYLRREHAHGRTNSYWMKPPRGGGLHAAPNDAEERSTRRRGAGPTPPGGRCLRRPNPGSNPGMERGEYPRAPAPQASLQRTGDQSSSKSNKSTNSSAATPLPENWPPGPAEFKIAENCAGWDAERANSEFGKFIAYQKSRGRRSADWLATWELWCRNGKSFDAKSLDASPTSFRGSRGALRGLQRWVADPERRDKKLDS